MSGDVFRALKDRALADRTWKRICRTLYRGLDPERAKSVSPYVVWMDTGGESLDTFSDDFERLDGEFVVISGRVGDTKVDEMVAAMIHVFDDARWETGELTIETLRQEPPTVTIEDGTYEARMAYQVYASRHSLVPAIRGV